MTPNITELTHDCFHEWLCSIVDGELFVSRERLARLLAENSPWEMLVEEFREFFGGYEGLGVLLESHEEAILSALAARDAFSHLKHRVTNVEKKRKTSPSGRVARRMGLSVIGDPVPEKKVTALAEEEFRELINMLVHWEIFAVREQLVKLMRRGSEIAGHERLKATFWEFFVCYLELELFLEDYNYDPDEGLDISPEFAEELDRADEYIKSGGKMFKLEEVAEEFGIKLKCMNCN